MIRIGTVDKIAGAIVADRDKTARAGAIHDKIAEEVVEFLAEQPIEATLDNTVDPFIELVVLAADRVDENFVDTSIEAILVAEEQVDEFSVDPLIEAIYSLGTTDKEAEGPRFKPSSH